MLSNCHVKIIQCLTFQPDFFPRQLIPQESKWLHLLVLASRSVSSGETVPLGVYKKAWQLDPAPGVQPEQRPPGTTPCPRGRCLTANSNTDPKPQQKGVSSKCHLTQARPRSGLRRHLHTSIRRAAGTSQASPWQMPGPTCHYNSWACTIHFIKS